MFWLAEIFNGRYTADELQRIEHWARRERAETVHALFSAAGHGLARAAVAAGAGVKAAGTGLRRWQRKRAAIRELSGLSDHILKDIGLHRGDIRPVVDELLDRPVVERLGDSRREVRTELRAFPAPRQAEAPAAGSRDAETQRQRAA